MMAVVIQVCIPRIVRTKCHDVSKQLDKLKPKK